MEWTTGAGGPSRGGQFPLLLPGVGVVTSPEQMQLIEQTYQALISQMIRMSPHHPSKPSIAE